jgi:hypothetical protein
MIDWVSVISSTERTELCLLNIFALCRGGGGDTNPGFRVAATTKLFMVAPNICGFSV